MTIHHIGYLVKKIDRAIDTFVRLGYTIVQPTIRDMHRKIDVCFIAKDGYTVELVSPFSKESVVAGILKKLRNAPYHICYKVSDIDTVCTELQQEGYVLCAESHEAVACNGKQVCFLVHPYLGMIELLEQ